MVGSHENSPPGRRLDSPLTQLSSRGAGRCLLAAHHAGPAQDRGLLPDRHSGCLQTDPAPGTQEPVSKCQAKGRWQVPPGEGKVGGWGGLRGSVGEEFLQAEGQECGGPGAGDGSLGASGGCCRAVLTCGARPEAGCWGRGAQGGLGSHPGQRRWQPGGGRIVAGLGKGCGLRGIQSWPDLGRRWRCVGCPGRGPVGGSHLRSLRCRWF